jgi:arabinose-5-phosphate isomerase
MINGDVRRLIGKGEDFKNKAIDVLMIPSPKTIDEQAPVTRTIEFMQRGEITTLVVVNSKNRFKGYIHLHNILGRGGTLKISLNL